MTVAVDSEFSSPAIVSVAASRMATISRPIRPIGSCVSDERRDDVVDVGERRVARRRLHQRPRLPADSRDLGLVLAEARFGAAAAVASSCA